MSAGDATLPLVLALQKFDTLSLFTYRLAGSYRFPEACASGLVLGLICMTVFSVASHVSFQPNSRRHSR
jgi:thiamine transport system permease protein